MGEVEMDASVLVPHNDERARWRAGFQIAVWDEDQLAFASQRSMEKDGLWLPPDGANARCPRRLRSLLRRAKTRPVTVATMAALGVKPLEVREYVDNVLITAGATRILNLATSNGGTAWSNTVGRIMVGDGGGSAPTAAASDTDLAAAVASANRYCQLFAAAPTVSGTPAAISVTATFSSANGNFHWFEFAVDQGTASGATAATAPLLSHKGLDMGTKSSSVAWTASYSFSLS